MTDNKNPHEDYFKAWKAEPFNQLALSLARAALTQDQMETFSEGCFLGGFLAAISMFEQRFGIGKDHEAQHAP